MKNLIIVLVLVFVFVSCGHDELTLSSLVIGSWVGIESEMTSTLILPGGSITGVQKWTITFYTNGEFDFIASVTMSADDKPIGNFKFVTKGNYEAFENNIAFRPDSTEIQVIPSELKPVMDEALKNQMENFKSAFTGTMSASVSDNILVIDKKRFQKV